MAPTPSTAPRVVVADDSGFMRRLLRQALESAGLNVVGDAADGDEALALCHRLRPDVLTLDLAMPGRDGIGVLEALRTTDLPTVVLVVSAFSPAHGARAVDALAEGAFDLAVKPEIGTSPSAFLQEIGIKARSAASAAKRPRPAVPAAAASPALLRASANANGNGRANGARGRAPLVVIACSTGGPRALAELLPRLPSPLGAGTLVIQHMPPGFTAALAARLDRASALHVREAVTGDVVGRDDVLIAPGGSHMHLLAGGRIQLSDEEAAIGGLRPRADLTIADAARHFGSRLLLVVLTGMGRDGLDGARAVKLAGGRILVEAESTCSVYGMPRAVSEANLADGELALHDLPQAIASECA
ncbi:MAG: two-component system, chemotaxis family, protein-glutamate methylesterase/glutaminase [Solirubrobacteraceae bacterium]|nr:two-component system, chemotaxis family, protein-glutamate methylesterase/glutaminase [Solirubrobacteraceae bacterium]